MMYILSLAIALVPLAVHTSASFLSVLASRPELSQFNAYLSQFPRLTTTINTVDNATLLIPSNTAFTKWLQNTVPPLTPSDIENTLNYHIIHGTFPVASFTNTAQFVPSFLTNTSYSNVTEGLLVGLINIDGNPQVRSGLGTNSSIITPDLIANGGLIHILDSVLQLPQSQSTTAAALNLSFYTAILQAGNFLSNEEINFTDAIVELPDVTYFLPNTAGALAMFKSISSALTHQQRDAMLEYHVVTGFVGVSSDLINMEVIRTVQGSNLTIFVGPDGSKFVNNVKIIATDYLINNGVLHTIDGLLNPNNITAPVFNYSPLFVSRGALTGIVIGGVFVAFFISVAMLLYIRRRKRRPKVQAFSNLEPTPTEDTPHSRSISRPLYELEPQEKGVIELIYDPSAHLPELAAVKMRAEPMVYRDPVTQKWTPVNLPVEI